MKKLDMTPEEREEHEKELGRKRAQKCRDKKRNPIPDAWDYQMPDVQSEQLRKYADEISQKVRDELNLNSLKDDSYIVEGVARTLFALEKKWTQQVQNPSGILAGWFFPDALASEVIPHIRKTRLLDSPTFAEVYKRFIPTVAAFCDKTPRLMTVEYVEEIKRELARQSEEPELPPIPA